MLNKTSLIDAGSTTPTWVSMWLSLFNGFFEGCECWKVFHIIFHMFPNFRSQLGKWFCAMYNCANWLRIENGPVDLFLALYTVVLFMTSFGDNPLSNLYSSVARTWIFLWCTETKLSISKRSVKQDALSLHIIRKHLWCNLFILLFNVGLWKTHYNGQYGHR